MKDDRIEANLRARMEQLERELQACKNAEKDLRAEYERLALIDRSEARYRSIFEGSGEGILLAEAYTMRLHSANPAFCRFSGYSQDELVTMHVLDIHPDWALTRVRAEFEEMAEGKRTVSKQMPCLRQDGRVVYADIRTAAVPIDGKQYLAGFFADVTEQYKAYSALSEQAHFLQNHIDTLPHPTFYKDKNGIFLGCNQSFEMIVGLPKEKIVGKDAYAILPKHIADADAASDKQVFASGRPHTYDTIFRDVQGAEHSVIISKAVFFRKDGSLGGLAGTIIDISELKRIEVEKTLLAAAIEQTPEMVIITDPDGRISYANPAFERISGYNRQHAIGRSTAILQSGRQSDEFYSNLWQTLKNKKTWSGRMTNRRKDGSLYEVEATIVPVQNPDGQVANYLAVERDISQEIVREKQLRQAHKMEAIGTLAGGIAHDFNNILSAILGFTEIAMCDLEPQAPPYACLRKVLSAGERARDLVNHILAFSRSTEQEMRPVKAQTIVKEALKLLQATLPSTIRITSRMESSSAVMADPTQIHQLIINLCTNAAHAMQDSGGELIVSLADKPLEKAALLHPGDQPPGDYLHLSVDDTGCGMEPKIIERIFDPFFTTKKQGEGTGMGLSVVHGIVKGCGGSIQVHSTLGKGTLFEILLPVIKSEQASVPDLDSPLPVGSGHILFVDDEPFQVELGRQMLQRLGYQVTALNDSRLALEQFIQAPVTFDLLITDMTMPNMTGDQLATHIMDIRPDIPVIICTGYSQKLAEIQNQPGNISGIAYKPLVMRDLANLVREALDKK